MEAIWLLPTFRHHPEPIQLVLHRAHCLTQSLLVQGVKMSIPAGTGCQDVNPCWYRVSRCLQGKGASSRQLPVTMVQCAEVEVKLGEQKGERDSFLRAKNLAQQVPPPSSHFDLPANSWTMVSSWLAGLYKGRYRLVYAQNRQ